MAKIEVTLTDEEKARLQAAADRSALKLATWAKAKLLLSAIDEFKWGVGNGRE